MNKVWTPSGYRQGAFNSLVGKGESIIDFQNGTGTLVTKGKRGVDNQPSSVMSTDNNVIAGNDVDWTNGMKFSDQAAPLTAKLQGYNDITNGMKKFGNKYRLSSLANKTVEIQNRELGKAKQPILDELKSITDRQQAQHETENYVNTMKANCGKDKYYDGKNPFGLDYSNYTVNFPFRPTQVDMYRTPLNPIVDGQYAVVDYDAGGRLNNIMGNAAPDAAHYAVGNKIFNPNSGKYEPSMKGKTSSNYTLPYYDQIAGVGPGGMQAKTVSTDGNTISNKKYVDRNTNNTLLYNITPEQTSNYNGFHTPNPSFVSLPREDTRFGNVVYSPWKPWEHIPNAYTNPDGRLKWDPEGKLYDGLYIIPRTVIGNYQQYPVSANDTAEDTVKDGEVKSVKTKSSKFKFKNEGSTEGNGRISEWDLMAGRVVPFATELGQLIGWMNRKPIGSKTYARNPYESTALNTMASLRYNPYPEIKAQQDAERRAAYGLMNAGGLTGAQRYIGRVAGGIGNMANAAIAYRNAETQNNAYRQAYAQMAGNLGAQDAQRKQAANQFDYDTYAKSHGQWIKGIETHIAGLGKQWQQYYADRIKNRLYNSTLNLYQQDLDNNKRAWMAQYYNNNKKAA